MASRLSTKLIVTKAIAEILESIDEQVQKRVAWVMLAKARPSTRRETIVVSLLGEMTAETTSRMRFVAGSKSRYLVFADRLPFEAISERIAALGVRNPERLHIARECGDDRRALLGRLAMTISERDAHQILDAWWEEDQLMLLSHHFRRLRIPRRDLLTVRGFGHMPPGKVKDFEVHSDGAYLHWPSAEVHMSWDQFERVADPDFRRDRGAAFRRQYGEAIRELRERTGLRQADIEGLAARHLRRVECGEQPATSSTLAKLARAHRMRIAEYVAELAELVSATAS